MMTSSLAGTAGKEAPAENKEKNISDVHDDLPSTPSQWRYFAASAFIAVGATAFGIHKQANTTINVNNNEELAMKDKTVCNDGAFDITFHEPEESYKGDIAEILVTDMIEGSLVGCEWEDGDFYEGIVQNTHYDSDDSEEELLVIWYEDALEEWVPAQDCELMDEQIIWKAGQFRYNIHQDHRFDEFHRAFKAVAEEFPDSPPALFTYWGGPQVVTSLETIPREITLDIDHKYTLYQTYKDNPITASAFPQTFATIEEALASPVEDDEVKDPLFFIKDSGGTQGKGIRVVRRSELESEKEPELGEVVIQKSINVLTINDAEGKGALHQRRFDIRFYMIIVGGKAYLHSNMYAMWAHTSRPFDPLDTDTENQLPKLQLSCRDFLFFPFEGDESSKAFDPVSWRNQILSSMIKARPTLDVLLQATASDPSSYHLLAGDAIIDQSDRAIIVEYNDWPGYSIFNEHRSRCVDEGQCCRRIVSIDEKEASRYSLSAPSAEFYHFAHGYRTQIFQDLVLLVLRLKESNQLPRLLEITERTV
eukprot:scaffold13688_cov157-Skeletonema_marinoi.AAC.3